MLTSFLVLYNFISHTSYYVPYALHDLSNLIITMISFIYKGEYASLVKLLAISSAEIQTSEHLIPAVWLNYFTF